MCIFCKIISKEEPSQIVFENDQVVAFYDINPKAPVHILVCPRKHIASMKDIDEQDGGVLVDMLLSAKKIAREQNIDEGYKLLFNVGRSGGQIIDHIHLHLMGGWQS